MEKSWCDISHQFYWFSGFAPVAWLVCQCCGALFAWRGCFTHIVNVSCLFVLQTAFGIARRESTIRKIARVDCDYKVKILKTCKLTLVPVRSDPG